jgi:hypothetical protein
MASGKAKICLGGVDCNALHLRNKDCFTTLAMTVIATVFRLWQALF